MECQKISKFHSRRLNSVVISEAPEIVVVALLAFPFILGNLLPWSQFLVSVGTCLATGDRISCVRTPSP